MGEIFEVPTRGVGKPDYSKTVSSALERRGIRLQYGQTLVVLGLVFSNVPSPFSWVFPPLAPGGIARFIDHSTGLPTPLPIPQGYILFLVSGSESGTEDVEAWGYLDGFLSLPFGIFASGGMYYENKVIGLSTELIDPTGETAHTIDTTVENVGAGDFRGQLELIGILEAVGTPPLPTTKTVRCKFCGYEEVKPKETTRWICPKCGKLSMFYDLTKFRGTR